MINSRAKGKRSELELSKLFTSYGLDARRSQQYCGTESSADITFEDEDLNQFLHVECKHNETLNVEKALQQAERDSDDLQLPIVCHRKNREDWKVTMRFTDFLDFFKSYWELTNA